jgi:hypothetical protein
METFGHELDIGQVCEHCVIGVKTLKRLHDNGQGLRPVRA